MDASERAMAQKLLDSLKTINRNINYIGRKLEETNKVLEKFNGIAVFPTEHVEEKGDTNETEE